MMWSNLQRFVEEKTIADPAGLDSTTGPFLPPAGASPCRARPATGVVS